MARPTVNCLRCLFSHTPNLSGRRMFASTPVNAVLRCQETYTMTKPEIDRSGRPRRREATIDISEGDFRNSPFRRDSRDSNTSGSRFGRTERDEGLRYANNTGFERSGGSGKFGKKGGSGSKAGFGMMRPNGSIGEVSKSTELAREDYGRKGNFTNRPSGSGERFEKTGSGRDNFQRAQSGGFEEGRFGSRGDMRNRGEDGRMDYNGGSGSGEPSRMRDEGSRRFENGRLGREPNKLDRSSGQHWTAGRPDHRSMHGGGITRHGTLQAEPDEPWAPTKKLTFQAMAGLRALHTNDPETFNREALSQRYGISYDAVTRILRSGFQDRKGQEMGEKIQGTKWDMNPGSSRLSPVRAINRAFGKV
jgi:hypothetical protein